MTPSVIALGDYKGQFVPLNSIYLEYIKISPYLRSKRFTKLVVKSVTLASVESRVGAVSQLFQPVGGYSVEQVSPVGAISSVTWSPSNA